MLFNHVKCTMLKFHLSSHTREVYFKLLNKLGIGHYHLPRGFQRVPTDQMHYSDTYQW